jgi:hypothetical protein
MKKLLLVATLVLSGTVFAYGEEKFDISSSYKTLHATEAEALALGLKIEAKIKAGKFKSVGNENFNCEFGADVKYYTKNVEIKKLYVDGVAKYKTIVNSVMECEPEYDM